ncbi:Glu/Leu/Phe/Val dehydrogenase dimerization domain-containing protein [Actinoplanes sp. NPDC051861]|uniref:Glu/Leu/Phe/Val dehydrogenase dimerization domain-containing protein n=1 Tax=Actinoplanes sp. NPDC051861 TaxID=3155170 RepID=UPI00344A64D7
MLLTHQRVVVERGSRSGLPIVVAVHSTVLGQAIGGCRLTHYADWRDGLDDALRLSAAMTEKAALAGLPHGGGKTVIALPPGTVLDEPGRRAVLHDAGDVIARLGGTYATGPDVGTGPADMETIGERTPYVFCRPAATGGSGDSSPHTAAGVLAALRAVAAERFGSPDLAGRSFAVLGLGRVGSHVLRLLTEAGGHVITADVDESRRAVAEQHGATWTDPDSCLTAEVDVLVPAALGGLLTPATVPRLACSAIAGPANNQLAGVSRPANNQLAGVSGPAGNVPGTARLLHERGILWAPDVVVSAGGIVHAIAAELHRESAVQIAARIDGIGETLAGILRAARETGCTPAESASRLATFLLGERAVPAMAAC